MKGLARFAATTLLAGSLTVALTTSAFGDTGSKDSTTGSGVKIVKLSTRAGSKMKTAGVSTTADAGSTDGVIPGFEQCAQLEGLVLSDCGFKNLTLTAPDITVPVGTKEVDQFGFIMLKGDTLDDLTVHLDGPVDVGWDGSTALGGFEYYWGTNYGLQDPTDFFTATLIDKNSDVAAYWYNDFWVETFDTLTANTDSKLNLRINAATQPGTWRIQIPVSQLYWGNMPDGSWTDPMDNPFIVKTETITKNLVIRANPANSKLTSSTSRSGSKGRTKKMTFNVEVPGYQAGAKATVYYQQKGKKTWKAVASGTVNTGSDWDMRHAKMVTKKGAIRHAGKYFVRVGSVVYSGGWDTAVKTIK